MASAVAVAGMVPSAKNMARAVTPNGRGLEDIPRS
jgi:hypothetical protein